MTRNIKASLLRAISLLAVIAVAITCLAACGEPNPNDDMKSISVTVVFADGGFKAYDIETDAAYLADALLEEGVIAEKAEDGYYTTVAGVTADYSVDKGWWCVTKDGEMTAKGINELVLADGDKYEITYTIG